MPRTIDPVAARQRRMRIIALVGVLLLAVLLVIQVPRTLRMLEGPEEETAPATETAPVETTDAPAPADGTTAGEATPPAQPVKLVESDPDPAPEDGDLRSLERFTSKDPFVQQISDPSAAVAGAAAPAPGAGAAPAPVAPPPASPPPPASAPPPAAPAAAAPAGGPVAAANPAPSTSPVRKEPRRVLRSATVVVNGSRETVGVSETFPKADPAFRLVSLAPTSAKIAIAGGSFTNGAKTMTLRLRKLVTLVNTTTGRRYRLCLASVPASSSGSCSPTLAG